ncbi:hypothetical protein FOL46_001450 [Perkinsus olseni]|uniref:K Homology domain-containing protein n=1 Tax=Perkinsus olseni TaxID=32597 RepID=A0A7J6MCZ5_PEROL|nr:hypothetical protein FOL46_001450 [Perkinsus olseni]
MGKTAGKNSPKKPRREEATADTESNTATKAEPATLDESMSQTAATGGSTETPAVHEEASKEAVGGGDDEPDVGVSPDGQPAENTGPEDGSQAAQSQPKVDSMVEALGANEDEMKGEKRPRDELVEQDGSEAGDHPEPSAQAVLDGPFPEVEGLLSVGDGPSALLDKGEKAGETTQCADPRRLKTAERLVVSWEHPPPNEGEAFVVETGDMGETVVPIPAKDVPCFVGKGGTTQSKIIRASGVQEAAIKEEYDDGNGDEAKEQMAAVVLSGTEAARKHAEKYIRLVLSRHGAEVKVDLDKDDDGDLTVMRDVPRSAVALILGTKGAKLRGMEERCGTMAFLLGNTEPLAGEDEVSPDKVVLAIFGAPHHRKRCEMEVRDLVEAKVHGYYTKHMKESLSTEEGEASDIIKMDVASWDWVGSIGQSRGVQKSDAILLFEDHVAVKKQLELLSGATISRLSDFVDVFGTKKQRVRAREYMKWTVAALLGEAIDIKDAAERDDCTEVEVPTELIDVLFGKGRRHQLRQLQDKFTCLLFLGKEPSDDKTAKKKAENGDDSGTSAEPTSAAATTTTTPSTTTTTPLVIVGPWSSRRRCMYEILAEIEAKIPGWITSSIEPSLADEVEGYACDRLWLPQWRDGDDGKSPLRDYPLSAASGAIVTVIGPMVFVEGDRDQRQRCEQYIKWLLVASRRLSEYQSRQQREEEEKERQERHKARRVTKSLEPWQEADLRAEHVKGGLSACLVLSRSTLEGRDDCTEVNVLGDATVEQKEQLLEMTVSNRGTGKGRQELETISSRTGTLCLLAADRPLDEQIEQLPGVRVVVLGRDDSSREASASALRSSFRDLLWEKGADWHRSGRTESAEWNGSSPKGRKWDSGDWWRDSGRGGKWTRTDSKWEQSASKSWSKGDPKWTSGSGWRDWKQREDYGWEQKQSWGGKEDDRSWRESGRNSWSKGDKSNSWEGWEKDRWGNWQKKDESFKGRREEPTTTRTAWAWSPPMRPEPSRDTWFKREMPRLERPPSSGAPSIFPRVDDYRYSTYRDVAPPPVRQAALSSTPRYSYRTERPDEGISGGRGRSTWQREGRRDQSPQRMAASRYRESPPKRGVPTERFYQVEDSYYYRPSAANPPSQSSMPTREGYFQRPESPKRRRVEAPMRPAWEGRRDSGPAPRQQRYDGYYQEAAPTRGLGAAPGQLNEPR